MQPRYERLLSRLELQRTSLLRRLEAIDPEVLRRQPAPGSWSLLQVAHHLALTEEALLARMEQERAQPRTLHRRPMNYVGYALMTVVMVTSIRVPMPEQVRELVAPPDDGDLAGLRTRWEGSGRRLREHFAAYGPEDRRRLVGLHPAGGPLTPTQVLLFLTRHFGHHERQMKRITAQLGHRGPASRADQDSDPRGRRGSSTLS